MSTNIATASRHKQAIAQLNQQLDKSILGQERLTKRLLIALLSDGHFRTIRELEVEQ